MFVNGSGQNGQSLQRTFHRCFLPSFGSFGKAVSEEKIFKNRPIRNKNCLWWPCLLIDWDEMSNLYRGPSIDASYQVSVLLAEGFQRHISVIQFRYLYRDFLHFEYRCLYLNKSYLSFNRKEDFLEINQSETRIACGGHVC